MVDFSPLVFDLVDGCLEDPCECCYTETSHLFQEVDGDLVQTSCLVGVGAWEAFQYTLMSDAVDMLLVPISRISDVSSEVYTDNLTRTVASVERLWLEGLHVSFRQIREKRSQNCYISYSWWRRSVSCCWSPAPCLPRKSCRLFNTSAGLISTNPQISVLVTA